LGIVTTQAAIVDGPGALFEVHDVTLDGPRAGEVLVRIVAAGVCHTDLGMQAAGLPYKLPVILGHEGAGVVQSTGPGMDKVAPGDKVLLSFTSCGACESCRGGHPAYCDTWVTRNLRTGLREDGTPVARRRGQPVAARFFGQSSFAAHAIVDERSIVKVDPDADLSVLAPLGCGVQTGVGAVWKVLRPEPGQTLAVFGCGAVGMSAIMAAALLPLEAIVAVDRVSERLDLARSLGATHVIDTRTCDAREVIAQITQGHGIDHAVETTANPEVLRTSIDALATRGTCAVVGAPRPGTEASFDVSGMLPGKQIVGVTLGDGEPDTFLPMLMKLHAQGRLPLEKLVRYYPLADLNRAADDMRAGRTIKPVIRF